MTPTCGSHPSVLDGAEGPQTVVQPHLLGRILKKSTGTSPACHRDQRYRSLPPVERRFPGRPTMEMRWLLGILPPWLQKQAGFPRCRCCCHLVIWQNNKLQSFCRQKLFLERFRYPRHCCVSVIMYRPTSCYVATLVSLYKSSIGPWGFFVSLHLTLGTII